MSTDPTQLALEVPLDSLPTPVFPIGISKVRWKPVSSSRSDWGRVMGLRYRWAKHLGNWQWQFYVVLDPDSPSYQWVRSDWAWQDDLESLSTSYST